MDYHLNLDVVWRNGDQLLYGLVLGLQIAVVSLVIGTIVGLLFAYARVNGPRWMQRLTAFVVGLVRNSPLLLLVYLIYFGFPAVGVRILDNIESFVFALSIYSSAYLSEIFRAGLSSIPRSYLDGARSIGLTTFQRQRYVVLPVMFRYVLPSLGTTFISLFKDTSIATAIAVPELTYVARQINTNTFRVVEAWGAASVLYLCVCLALALFFRALERRYAAIR